MISLIYCIRLGILYFVRFFRTFEWPSLTMESPSFQVKFTAYIEVASLAVRVMFHFQKMPLYLIFFNENRS